MDVFYAGMALNPWVGDLTTASRVAAVQTEADRQKQEILRLQAALDRQALACQALWELLQQHLPVGEKDLLKKMEQVDLRDGVADGRITPQAKICPACNRSVHPQRKNCLYCGADVGGPPTAV